MGIIILFGCMFGFLALTVPIPMAIGIALIIYVLTAGPGSTLDLAYIAQNMYVSCDNFALLAIPLFILAGDLMKTGGLSIKIINVAKAIIGSLTGGFGMITVLACMFFGAISGSAPATCAAIGSIMIPAMEENGYDKEFAAGLVASSGMLGVIIPPSIPMVVFGMTVGCSISTLFLAGFIPGIIGGLALMVVTYFIAKKRGYLGTGVPFSWLDLWKTTKDSFWAIMMPVIILGGIYGGVFTPTEAAAVAVVYGLVIGLFVYKELKWREILQVLSSSAVTGGGVLIIAGVGGAMAKIMSIEHVPALVQQALAPLATHPIIILLIINIIMLMLGCVMDTIPAIIIFAPIFYAAVTMFHMNPYHFGLVMVFNFAIGMITPPVGLNLFVVTGMTGVPVMRLARAALPFILVLTVVLLLLTYVPAITLILPQLMGFIS